MKYDRIHKVLDEGSVALVASEDTFAGRQTAFHVNVSVFNQCQPREAIEKYAVVEYIQ